VIKKICLITGATSGIGLETARALASQCMCVIIVGRNREKCERTVIINRIRTATGNSSVDYLMEDLSSQKDIRQLCAQFLSRYKRLDILINNAGAKIVKRQVTFDGFEMTFSLNHLAYFLLTNLLLDTLKKSGSARIINVASGAHGGCPRINFDDLQSEKGYVGKVAYAQSKLANILFTYELARRLEGTSVTVNALHPGGVISDFCKNNGLVSWAKHVTAHLLHGNLVSPKEGA
jgi:NAD(P)-dependent dehydrogenase (short-subunit alcohol dehydrogenase family)